MSKTQTIERAPDPRQTALLTAVVRQLEAQAVDDALGLFAVLMANRLISPARRALDRDRLAMLPQLEKVARMLAKASKILTGELDLVAEAGTDLDVACCGRRWRRPCRVRRSPGRSRPSRPRCPRTTGRPRR
ncbi:hypothetical protein [Streptomyces hydrogenans]|uniref:hypothetical protein n=1 Tax=Streptomyces hydrogenans TaxID=1873719 RepID=UPI0035D637D7